MKRGTAAAAFLILFAAIPCIGESPLYTAEPSGEFLRSWLLCGPIPIAGTETEHPKTEHLPGFDTDYLASDGGETNPRVSEGREVAFAGGSARWFPYSSKRGPIDLDEAVSNEPGILAYAYCEVESHSNQACVLALGTNDGARVWLNGEEVWHGIEGRPVQPDEDLIPVCLQQGRNTLLFKVEERGGAWGFACRLLAFDSEEYKSDRLRMFRPQPNEDGTTSLKIENWSKAFKDSVKSVLLEAYPSEAPETAVWRSEWKGTETTPIEVDASQYGEYSLGVTVKFAGDREHTFRYPFSVGKRVDHVLFDRGKTEYTIVLGEDASESERWAALELRHWLAQVSGADFPIRSDRDRANKKEIVVGFNERSEELLGADALQPEDSDESFVYRNIGSTLLIWGGRQRGTMYGVMTFLEREMGCRWYTPDVSVAPAKKRYTFHYLHHTESPGIRVRNVFFKEAFNPIWAARNKVNGEMTWRTVRDQPGGVETYWSVHTFNRFMPPKEFFEEHPEYYSLIDGKRKAEHAQLCLTNPDVQRILKERVLDYMRKDPNQLIYSVSQNDGYGPCECEKCQALVEREGSESGPILTVVNQIAEAAEEEFPHKFIGTLAYVYSRKPPKTLRPRPNVVIRLCSFECDRAHDFYSSPQNASFLSDIEGWSKIAPHLYIWDYVVSFRYYILPFPNFYSFQGNVRCFRENNAIGVMPQGSYQSRGGEFAELRMNVLARLLWNPDCNVEEAIDDFMYGYYGRSGQYVRAYFDLLHDQVKPETHFQNCHPRIPLFSEALIAEMDTLFDRAEAVADSEEILHRVEMARLPVMHLKCRRTPEEAKREGTYRRFCEIVEREGITHFSEAGTRDVKAFHAEMAE